jgi:hypothetical protein
MHAETASWSSRAPRRFERVRVHSVRIPAPNGLSIDLRQH